MKTCSHKIAVQWLFLAFTFFAFRLFAVNEKTLSEDLYSQAGIGFIENRGQMMDTKGDPVPFVLFKAEAPGLNFWITESGITLQVLRYRNEESNNTQEDLPEKYKKLIEDNNQHVDWERIDIELKGAGIRKENIIKEIPVQGHTNFFNPVCPDGIYEVKEYEKITIRDVYPGIDWVFYHKTNGGVKYDFVVRPGANYKQIELCYKSKTPIIINDQGELEQNTAYGNIKENAPVSFYANKTIATQFKITDVQEINFHGDSCYKTAVNFLLSHNTSLDIDSGILFGDAPLIIDPQIVWATFHTGIVNNCPMSLRTDDSGNLFVLGMAYAAGFPVYNPGSGTYFQGTAGSGVQQGYILKFNGAGVRLWSTYYGGNNSDWPYSMAIDRSGNIFATGFTRSTNMPVQNPGSGAYFQGVPTVSGGFDLFILKFNNAGVRQWATYYGGSGVEFGNSIATDLNGNVFITGQTTSTNLPLQNPGGGAYYQATNNTISFGTTAGTTAFILKFTNTGIQQWGTYYGGSGSGDYGHAITTDNSGNVFVTGFTASSNFPVLNPGSGAYFQTLNGITDAFLLKFNNAGVLQWATYYGGSAQTDLGYCIATDGNGNVYVTGITRSLDLPVLNPGSGAYFQGTHGGGALDLFILKFNNAGVRQWATYYGGNAEDDDPHRHDMDRIAIDPCGNVYVTFHTNSTNLTTKAQGCSYNSNSYLGGYRDYFITHFSGAGVLKWATYFGGDGADLRDMITVDLAGNLFIVGESGLLGSSTVTPSLYPLTNPGGGAYYQTSAGGFMNTFIAKLGKIVKAQYTSAGCTCNGTATVEVKGACTSLQYKWYTSAWALAGTDSTADLLCPGTYAVEIKDTSECFTDTAYVTVAATPGGAVNTNTILSVCSGQSKIIHGISRNVPGIYSQTYTAINGCDSTSTVQLTVSSSVATNLSLSPACDSILYNSKWYYSTQSVHDTMYNASANGCDSIVTIALIISNPINTSYTVSICSGQSVFIHGVSQNTPGVYTQTFFASVGCDSISSVTMAFIGTAIVTNTSAIICPGDSILINNVWAKAAGTYSDTLSSSGGCDSIVRLSLAVSNVVNTSNNIYICAGQSTMIHGSLQSTSGIYSQTFVSISGCDSVSSLTLFAGSPIVTSDSMNTCSGKPVQIHGLPQATAGVYTQTFTASASGGCDSISSITLVVTSAGSGSINQTACNSYTANGQTFIASGTYIQTLSGLAVNGCDSIITLQLTINDIAVGNQSIAGCDSVVVAGVVFRVSGSVSDTITGGSVQGCDSITTISFSVYPAPLFVVSADTSVLSGSIVTLSAYGPGGAGYLWSTGETTTTINLQATTNSSYIVTVTDSNSCMISDTITITVLNSCDDSTQVFVPNSFSPNNDGQNDILKLYSNGIKEIIYFAIYDRWGEKVVETKDINVSWDGTYRNQLCDTGVYVYLLKYDCATTVDEVIKRGNISLLR